MRQSRGCRARTLKALAFGSRCYRTEPKKTLPCALAQQGFLCVKKSFRSLRRGQPVWAQAEPRQGAPEMKTYGVTLAFAPGWSCGFPSKGVSYLSGCDTSLALSAIR